MWALIWIQVAVGGGVIRHYHFDNYGSLDECLQAKTKASVMVTTKNTMVTCLELSKYDS